MRADSFLAAAAAASLVGVELQQQQVDQLERFHSFLGEEAIPAGGIGPNELDRLWIRHIADSLLFGVELGSARDCVDVGTGVGLPGIPLAIAFPEVRFTLIDRAGRRVDLARRATDILGLENCTVRQSDVAGVGDRFDRMVSRGALPPAELMIHVKQLLRPDGIAVIGLSARHRSQKPPPDTPGLETRIVKIVSEVLDTTVSLLRIEPT
jgi:16S rRNA (guanine527-N7)-methyltransferase